MGGWMSGRSGSWSSRWAIESCICRVGGQRLIGRVDETLVECMVE